MNEYHNYYGCSNTDKDGNDIPGEDRAPLFLVLNGLDFMTTCYKLRSLEDKALIRHGEV